jgi:plastocyanin
MQTKFKFVMVAVLGMLIASHAVAGPSPAGGTIAGKVTYEGTPAKMKPIDMSKEPSCAKMYATPQYAEKVVTGKGNSLENVLVYISAGAPDEPAPPTAALLEQKGCRYLPHVLVLQVNQELKIENEDETSHNVHPMPKVNQEWNKSQPPGAPPITDKYEKAEIFPVKCNVHPWMQGNIAVLKNSHYAITGDGGAFTLPNLPPGRYTVTAWQEAYGEQSQEVTISGTETKQINFVFKAAPY